MIKLWKLYIVLFEVLLRVIENEDHFSYNRSVIQNLTVFFFWQFIVALPIRCKKCLWLKLFEKEDQCTGSRKQNRKKKEDKNFK